MTLEYANIKTDGTEKAVNLENISENGANFSIADDNYPDSLEDATMASDARDGKSLENVRREIESTGSQYEKYKDNPSVQRCTLQLSRILGKSKEEITTNEIELEINKMLTMRSDYIVSTDMAGIDGAQFMEKFKPQQKWYRNVREQLYGLMHASSEFKIDTNPGWLGINTRSEAGKREGNNVKLYVTLPVGEYAFLQHLPELAKTMRAISIENDDVIKVKVPESMSGFLANNDSIVVHFKNKENIDKIRTVLRDWMQSHSITEAPRELGRTVLAADPEDTSFSGMISKNIAQWVISNHGKYKNEILVERAIDHAIRQSQKPPFDI